MGTLSYLSYISTFSVFAALFSIILQAYFASEELKRITVVLKNLKVLENQFSTNKPKIAIGYGACSDLFVNAVDFLNYTDFPSDFDSSNFNVDDINTKDEFLKSFAYYFQQGAASERYTTNRDLFQELVKVAKKHPTAEPKWALGGNAPVMGIRFHMEGADVLLGAKMSKKLKTHLQSDIKMPGELIDQDDIHLILEYKTGDQWGPFISPRANRYILHNDHHNPMISSLEEFDDSISMFKPRLFVVSGLQMMDNFPFQEKVRENRLLKVEQQMKAQDKSTLIHFEMASYVEIELLKLLLENVVPYTNSIGMNEQELDNLNQVMLKDRVSLISDSNPRVAAALHQMRSVFRTINRNYYLNKDTDASSRMLSRIHVHTLAYQAFMVVRGSEWKNTKNSAAKASLVAHRHVCGSTEVNPDAAYLILDNSFATSIDTQEMDNIPKRINLVDDNPVPCWNETITIEGDFSLDVEICVAPVLICKIAKQTAGAGDNISAAGLILQV